jgi:hypothetical protein
LVTVDGISGSPNATYVALASGDIVAMNELPLYPGQQSTVTEVGRIQVYFSD